MEKQTLNHISESQNFTINITKNSLRKPTHACVCVFIVNVVESLAYLPLSSHNNKPTHHN